MDTEAQVQPGWVPGRRAFLGCLAFQALAFGSGWFGDLGHGLLNERGLTFALRVLNALGNVLVMIHALVLMQLGKQRSSYAWKHFRHEIGLANVSLLTSTTSLFWWLRSQHQQAVGIMYMTVTRINIAVYQTPAIYSAWAYMLQVPPMVARDAYHSLFKLHNPALRVLVESGAQLLLLAVLDVFGHMIFLEPAAMPASETTPGGCGPGPLVGHGVEGDDTAAEVYSTYSDRRQDLDMELPMLAGVRMALWTTAWELQRQEGRLRAQLTADQLQHLQHQLHQQSISHAATGAPVNAAATTPAQALQQRCSMLGVAVRWAAEGCRHRWSQWRSKSPSVHGGTPGSEPEDEQAVTTRQVLVLTQRLDLLRALDTIAYKTQVANEQLEKVLLVVYKIIQTFDILALASFFVLPFTLKVGYQVLSSIISANQRWEDLRLNLPEVVLVVVGAFLCGKLRVEAVGKRLERAQALLYDLVPRHIANALMNQPQPNHSSTGFSAGDSSLMSGQLDFTGSHPPVTTTGSANGVIMSRLSSASTPGGTSHELLLQRPSYEIPASEVLRPVKVHTPLHSVTPDRPAYKRQASDLPGGASMTKSSVVAPPRGKVRSAGEDYIPLVDARSVVHATPGLPLKSKAKELHIAGAPINPYSSGLYTSDEANDTQQTAELPSATNGNFLFQQPGSPSSAGQGGGSRSYVPSWPGSGFTFTANPASDEDMQAASSMALQEGGAGSQRPAHVGLGVPFGSDLLYQGPSSPGEVDEHLLQSLETTTGRRRPLPHKGCSPTTPPQDPATGPALPAPITPVRAAAEHNPLGVIQSQRGPSNAPPAAGKPTLPLNTEPTQTQACPSQRYASDTVISSLLSEYPYDPSARRSSKTEQHSSEHQSEGMSPGHTSSGPAQKMDAPLRGHQERQGQDHKGPGVSGGLSPETPVTVGDDTSDALNEAAPQPSSRADDGSRPESGPAPGTAKAGRLPGDPARDWGAVRGQVTPDPDAGSPCRALGMEASATHTHGGPLGADSPGEGGSPHIRIGTFSQWAASVSRPATPHDEEDSSMRQPERPTRVSPPRTSAPHVASRLSGQARPGTVTAAGTGAGHTGSPHSTPFLGRSSQPHLKEPSLSKAVVAAAAAAAALASAQVQGGKPSPAFEFEEAGGDRDDDDARVVRVLGETLRAAASAGQLEGLPTGPPAVPPSQRSNSTDGSRRSKWEMAGAVAGAMANSVWAAGGALLRGLGSRPGSEAGSRSRGPSASEGALEAAGAGTETSGGAVTGGTHPFFRLSQGRTHDVSPDTAHMGGGQVPPQPRGSQGSVHSASGHSNERLPALQGLYGAGVEGGRLRTMLGLPHALALALATGTLGDLSPASLTGSVGSPSHSVAPGVANGGFTIMREEHPSVSVLMADIVGFTEASDRCEPVLVMQMLDDLFCRFDGLALRMSTVYKVETIGDCYFACAGLNGNDPSHARTLIRFGWAIIREAQQVLMPHSGQPVRIRVGINSGRVMAGLIGRIRRQYRLFGDTVNLASRMESTGSPGCVHISASTWMLTRNYPDFHFWELPPMEVKGKGRLTTFLVTPPPGESDDDWAQGMVTAAQDALHKAEQKAQQEHGAPPEPAQHNPSADQTEVPDPLLPIVSDKACDWGGTACLAEKAGTAAALHPDQHTTVQELFRSLEEDVTDWVGGSAQQNKEQGQVEKGSSHEGGISPSINHHHSHQGSHEGEEQQQVNVTGQHREQDGFMGPQFLLQLARGSRDSEGDEDESSITFLPQRATRTSSIASVAPLGLGPSHEPLWVDPLAPHRGGRSQRASLAALAARRRSVEGRPPRDDSLSWMPQDLDGGVRRE